MANTYFVAPNGNDNSPGTEAKPFKTIQRGAKALSAGDTLLVKAGTYVEQISVSDSGTKNNPITIKAYKEDDVLIDGKAGVGGLNAGLPAGQIART